METERRRGRQGGYNNILFYCATHFMGNIFAVSIWIFFIDFW